MTLPWYEAVGAGVFALCMVVALSILACTRWPTWRRDFMRRYLRRRRRRIEKKLDRQSAAVRAVVLQLARQLSLEQREASREMALHARQLRAYRHRRR